MRLAPRRLAPRRSNPPLTPASRPNEEVREPLGVVLAGGRSSRMGEDKATLEWEGEPMVARQLRLLRDAGVKDLVISRAPDQPRLPVEAPVILDAEPGLGPLSGIVGALERGGGVRPVFVLAVDMPGVSVTLLRRLLAARGRSSGVVPRAGDHWEPLCALYPAEALDAARLEMESGRRAPQQLVQTLFEAGRVRPFILSQSEGAALRSWNRPGDAPR